MSQWVKLKDALLYKDENQSVLLDDFVKRELHILLDNVMYYYDDTFITESQAIEFIYKIFYNYYPITKDNKLSHSYPKKNEKIKLKPLTLHQK